MSKSEVSPFAIIFDMDGVIIDSNPAHKVALHQFCEKYGYHLTDEYLEKNIYGRTNKDWISNLFGDLKDHEWKKFEHEKEVLFREIYAEEIKPVEGLIPFLKSLKENDIPRAIATSAPFENVEFTLEKLNIGSYFEIILDESDVTIGKPDPQIYLKTVNALSYPADHCIVIEDSFSGVEAAKNAGCKVIGITTTHTKDEFNDTDLVINSFNDLNFENLQDLIS
ncbi:MAG TPA: HAD family phosphatase [Balneolales bacterium]|nr:HAD family phosphatase [Balneolales bacterium]